MQLVLRPYVTAGVAVLGAGLIQVTPVAAPHIVQRPVDLVAAEVLGDLVGPLDAVSLAAADGTDWWTQLTDFWANLPAILVGLTFWVELFLSPIIMPVLNFFYAINDYLVQGWNWLLEALGLAPVAVADATADVPATAALALVDSVGFGLGGLDGLLDHVAVADLGAQLGADAIPDLGGIVASVMP